MKIIFLILILSIFSCESKKSDTSPLTLQKNLVNLKRIHWNEYLKSLNGDYQMYYKNVDLQSEANEKLFVEVRNTNLSGSSFVNGNKTMNDFYTLALKTIKNTNCKLSIEFYDKKPVIKKLLSECGADSSGFEIVEFFEGHPINF